MAKGGGEGRKAAQLPIAMSLSITQVPSAAPVHSQAWGNWDKPSAPTADSHGHWEDTSRQHSGDTEPPSQGKVYPTE